MNQSLCPYAVAPLTSAESNDEHILPVALGAPASFTVRALSAENSEMNRLIDAPTVNDPFIRFMAMAQGVVSRSGSVKADLDGTVGETGEKVRATFTQKGMELKFRSPVDTDDQGRVIGVRGFGDSARQMAAQIVAANTKKGISMELGAEISTERPQLNMGLSADTSMIRRQLFKIAYLTTVRIFGDAAISGQSGQLYRAAMMAKSDNDLALTNISFVAFQGLPPGCAKSSRKSEHAITCALIPNLGLMASVDLFGCFNLFVVTPAEGITANVGTGEVIAIDASSSTLVSRTYLEAAPGLMSANFRV